MTKGTRAHLLEEDEEERKQKTKTKGRGEVVEGEGEIVRRRCDTREI